MEQQQPQPEEAMFLVLPYLPLYELLCMIQVCRSLRDTIKGDILPWINILVVDKPLNSRLTDDVVLTKLAPIAGGRLSTLALLNCFRVSNDGLLRVVANNPSIEELYIPGCTGVTPEGVISAVQMLTNNDNRNRLKKLRVSGIYNMNIEHLQTLCNLLGIIEGKKQNPKNLYHNRNNISMIIQQGGDQASIDIDVCPICDAIRAVFDCSRDGCGCRGCIYCIRRCEECGVCITDDDDEQTEAACEDDLCLYCWTKLPKCGFCNRPYCNQHENRKLNLPESEGFLCASCHDNFVQNLCPIE